MSAKINFGFLNGFRGLMAVIVVIAHTNTVLGNPNKDDLFKVLSSLVDYMALPGFFLLSSFLLTYRFLLDLSASSSTSTVNSFSIQVHVAVKYFIRRFFRIYLVFCIFCFILKFSPHIVQYYFAGFRGSIESYSSFYNLITFTKLGSNHLWTIPVEVYYYFIIPFICLGVDAVLKRLQNNFQRLAFTSFLVLATIFAINRNLFSLTESQIQKGFYLDTNINMKVTFFVFVEGSLLAVVYLYFEKYLSESHKFIQNSKVAQHLLNLITLAWFVYCYKQSPLFVQKSRDFDSFSKPGLMWSIFLLLNLMSSSSFNYVKFFLETSEALLNCGKYSFGMYLLHPIAILVFFENSKLKNSCTTCELFGLILLMAYFFGFLWFHLVEKQMIKLADICCELADDYFHKIYNSLQLKTSYF